MSKPKTDNWRILCFGCKASKFFSVFRVEKFVNILYNICMVSLKIFSITLVMAICISIVTVGCSVPQDYKAKSFINPTSQLGNRFAKYRTNSPSASSTSTTSGSNVLDWSEGPKTNYNMNLGPRDVSFDFRIR